MWQPIQSTSTKQPIPHNPSEFDFLKLDYNKIINNNDEDDNDVRIQQAGGESITSHLGAFT